MVDVSALTSTDNLTIKIKEKVISGGIQAIVLLENLLGVQATPVWVSPSMILLNGWDMSITQSQGTARSFPFSIRKVG
jgi:hypothetical protein